MKTDAGTVAVLTAALAPGIDPDHISLTAAMSSVVQTLRPEALKLDTALIFSAVREAATSEERQRLAREMHDGVAQDLASFGYLIDDVAAGAESDVQRTRLTELRHELTRGRRRAQTLGVLLAQRGRGRRGRWANASRSWRSTSRGGSACAWRWSSTSQVAGFGPRSRTSCTALPRKA